MVQMERNMEQVEQNESALQGKIAQIESENVKLRIWCENLQREEKEAAQRQAKAQPYWVERQIVTREGWPVVLLALGPQSGIHTVSTFTPSRRPTSSLTVPSLAGVSRAGVAAGISARLARLSRKVSGCTPMRYEPVELYAVPSPSTPDATQPIMRDGAASPELCAHA